VRVSPSPPSYKRDNPIAKVAGDLRDQVRARRDGGLPPGPTSVSPARDRRFVRDPVSVLLSAHDEYGPVFTMRGLHALFIVMMGPEA
jgi:hypothetical protein